MPDACLLLATCLMYEHLPKPSTQESARVVGPMPPHLWKQPSATSLCAWVWHVLKHKSSKKLGSRLWQEIGQSCFSDSLPSTTYHLSPTTFYPLPPTTYHLRPGIRFIITKSIAKGTDHHIVHIKLDSLPSSSHRMKLIIIHFTKNETIYYHLIQTRCDYLALIKWDT